MIDCGYLNESASPVPAMLKPTPLGPRSAATLVAWPAMPAPLSTRTRTVPGNTPGGTLGWAAGGGVRPRKASIICCASPGLGRRIDALTPPNFTDPGTVGNVSMSTVSGDSDLNRL